MYTHAKRPHNLAPWQGVFFRDIQHNGAYLLVQHRARTSGSLAASLFHHPSHGVPFVHEPKMAPNRGKRSERGGVQEAWERQKLCDAREHACKQAPPAQRESRQHAYFRAAGSPRLVTTVRAAAAQPFATTAIFRRSTFLALSRHTSCKTTMHCR